MSLCCEEDDRRDAVRALRGRVGLDYVEVSEEAPQLLVYFLGELPAELSGDKPGAERYLRLEGGDRITGIRVVDVEPVAGREGAFDEHLLVRLDKVGDFSPYTLRLVGVEGVDPRYDHVDFSFHLDCPRDLDCASPCPCEPVTPPEPPIDYLAKDYESFRRLLLDRLAMLMPGWTERHVPDIGIVLVEVLAYAGDYLSYYQDAVATEAYLDTARERISVRRHARLVDFRLHEGCNARAWVCVEVTEDLPLDPAEASFVTGVSLGAAPVPTVLNWEALRDLTASSFEVFEPVVPPVVAPIQLRSAHNVIDFYTWGNRECCLEAGATRATLLDRWMAPTDPASTNASTEPSPTAPQPAEGSGPRGDGSADRPAPPRALHHLQAGDVLLIEEVIGPRTGLPADADPLRRHAVRLIKVTSGEDPVQPTVDGRPTPYVEVEWGAEDALPFPFCVSTIGPAPDCSSLANVSVARGNAILVDHGQTVGPEDLGSVPAVHTEAPCECADHPGEIRTMPGAYAPHLQRHSVTYRQAPPRDTPTTWKPAWDFFQQDPRRALPQVELSSRPPMPWRPRFDLLASDAPDAHFVVEIDNEGVAHLRFGDGELGASLAAGAAFTATYRVGNGVAGNVGAEAIAHLVLKRTDWSGVSVTVRNPLPASGGTDPEPTADAKLFAPHAFRTRIERAITADDYAVIAERNPRLQRAAARLVWTGSWHEADVAVDPLGREGADEHLLRQVGRHLHRFRRLGHDLRAIPASYVALDLGLEVCVQPHFQRAHVRAALLDLFSNRVLAVGRRGWFHPDNLTFGQGVYVSSIVAAGQGVPGVACVTVTRLHRRFEAPNHELETGVLPLRGWEIARLDNDGNHPERGRLEIDVSGGL